MRMLEAYRNLLRELDKYEAPAFDPGDFTYWMNSTINQYITNNYAKGDVKQKELDDIKVLLSDPDTELTQDGTNKSKFALPGNYLHSLNVDVDAKALSTFRRWTINTVQRFELRRERTNKKGISVRNVYEKPSEDYTKYRIVGNYIYALVGPNFEPTKMYMWYIKTPAVVTLGPIGSDYNSESFNSTLQFPEYVCLELIRQCKINVLENIESQRFQSSLALKQLEKD